MPATGLDFSGVDQFWKIVDILSRDSEPAEAQWGALLSTPGYRLAQTNLGPVVRQALEITFRPSRRARAAQLLPPGATRNGQPPLVAFALFKDDG